MTANVGARRKEVAYFPSGVNIIVGAVFCQPQAAMIAIESQTDCSVSRAVISESVAIAEVYRCDDAIL